MPFAFCGFGSVVVVVVLDKSTAFSILGSSSICDSTSLCEWILAHRLRGRSIWVVILHASSRRAFLDGAAC